MSRVRWETLGWETLLLDAWRLAGYRYHEAADMSFAALVQVLALMRE